MIPTIPGPPDWLVHWCLIYLAHIGPWLVRGLVVAHICLVVILYKQRRKPETGVARALRGFVTSKVGFWFLLAVAPGSGSSVASLPPWWIIAYAVVLTWVAWRTAWLLTMMTWDYIIPALWPGHGGHPVHVETMAMPKPWDGIERRFGPKDRRKSNLLV